MWSVALEMVAQGKGIIKGVEIGHLLTEEVRGIDKMSFAMSLNATAFSDYRTLLWQDDRCPLMSICHAIFTFRFNEK